MAKKVYILEQFIQKKNNSKVIILDTFKDIECELDEIKYKISYLSNTIEILLESETLNFKELDDEFFKLYKYINILLGFYPPLISGTEFDVKDLANVYKTGEKYIIAQENFVIQLKNKDFKESYSKFKKLLKKLDFSLSYFSYATSILNESYPEFPLVNLLQVLDGIYDYLAITENNRVIYSSKSRIERLKRKINNIDIKHIIRGIYARKTVKKYISNSISRLEFVNFDTKLRYLFNHIDKDYRVFQLEKQQKDQSKNFEKFIIKCKHTRNKFSHSIVINNSFNGVESVFYIYKIILVIRILIIEEIGLKNFIDKNLLKYLIKITDERLVEELDMEEIDYV